MNDQELTGYVSLSKALGGHVRHPKLVPLHERPGYLQILSAWCASHPRSTWPAWLRDLEAAGELQAAGQGSGGAHSGVERLSAGE